MQIHAPARPSISVIVPAYNEEANVEDALGRCLQALARFTDHPQVVVVNDGSQDRTGELIDAAARRNPAVRAIHNPINLGAGISLLIGMRAAIGDLVIHDAMDYPFDLNDLDRVLPLFPENDVVIIVRKDRSAHSVYRKMTSLVHYGLVRTMFRVPFRDMNFVQMYKRDVLQKVLVRGKSPAFVTPELLIRAQKAGFNIAQVEAVFHRRERGNANYGKPRDILWTLADMLSYRFESWQKAG